MNSLLAFLLRSGAGLLKDGAEVLISQALIRAVTQRLKGLIVFYVILAAFALAALVFLYVLLYRFLASRLGDVSAAAILCGANLLLVVLMVAGRAVFRPKPIVESAASPIVALLKASAEGLGGKDLNFDAGIAIGHEIGRHIRKATPQIALAAVVLGLVIGIRPQILGLFRRREPPAKKP
jgi:hypothetical protein